MSASRIDFSVGPFKGMRYLSNFTKWDPSYVLEAQDAFPTADGIYAVRCADNAVSPTGASASATIQGEVVFEQASGTLLDVLVLNGEIWGRTPNDFTRRVTTANLTTASITLNSSGRVYLTIFNNTVVVSDGTNTPFTWDGTTGAGGLVKLTNAPVFYGPPTVFYAKIFGVKNTERDTLVWSEELAANTGYEAGGFSNAWKLRQSGSGPLHRILGRNEALYYWRARSIGSIRGAVTTDFTAAGVHDDISEEVGTTAPESVLEYEGYIWFVDAEGRPHRFAPGGQIEPIWKNIAAAFVHGGTDSFPGSVVTGQRALDLAPATIARTLAAPFPFHRAVVFAWQQSSQSSLHQNAIAFGADSGEALSKITVQAVSSGFRGSHLAAGLHPSLDYPCLVYGGLKSSDNTVQLVSFGSPVSAYRTGTSCQLWAPAFVAPPGSVVRPDLLRVGVVVGPGASSATCSVTASMSPNTGFNRPADHYNVIGSGPIVLSAISAPSHRIATWGPRGQELSRLYFHVGLDTTGSAIAGIQSIELAAWELPRHPTVTT